MFSMKVEVSISQPSQVVIEIATQITYQWFVELYVGEHHDHFVLLGLLHLAEVQHLLGPDAAAEDVVHADRLDRGSALLRRGNAHHLQKVNKCEKTW